MKKMMLAGLLLAMSSIVMADSAQDVLKKARDDYYKQQEADERVVRSVAREEKELDGYNEVLGKKKTAKVKQQKAEKPAKTKKK